MHSMLVEGTRWVLMVGAVMTLAVACGGSGTSASSSSTGEPSTSVTTTTTEAAPQIDPAVVRWKKKWRSKVDLPMLRAVVIMRSNAIAAVNGSAAASYRVTRAFNALSNCRNPLEFPPLLDTPSALRRARALTLKACKAFYVGTSQVISGFNAQSSTTVAKGLATVKKGKEMLRRAAAAVKAAPNTT